MGDPLIDVDTIVGAYAAFADVDASEQTRRIAAASASIEAYVGRPLGLTAVTAEPHRPESSRMIYLRITPIVSISSIVYGRPGSQTTLVADDDYAILDADAGSVELYRSFAAGYRSPDRTYGGDPRAGTLLVSYTGGWATEDMPADIQDAAIHAVIARGATVALSGAGIYASEQLGEYSYRISSTSFDSSGSASAGLPPTVTGPLRKYKQRIRIV